ncbi:squalene--hopene cyclase [Commensalibacter nepenthis]|uniref:Squalene--hopene cyclase n=1 Tax=Commensalibacter nepenthis TaxID=3043872 RepID=A0ABT6Q866_9PROT|nr:squalene--hopene cyclase [Commensalibacter sp. TBRC 10068]MDI2112942.1 squalene--hopene cyclase [Commensalibacter sp. TBRC 10068]
MLDHVDSLENTIKDEALDHAILQAQNILANRQNKDGHWVFELEADATIPAEYVLLEHFLDRIDTKLEEKIGVYLRRIQGDHGGWPLYYGGNFNISASVKAYFALKAIGDDIDAPHMKRARTAILAHGGAEVSNVFTRTQLALFGEVPWHATPAMPVELMLMPKWVLFSVWNMSYWSRTVIAPLVLLVSLKGIAVNRHNIHVQELFVTPPEQIKDWIKGPFRSQWGYLFKYLDKIIRPAEKLFPRFLRKHAQKKTVEFIEKRLNGEDGLGAIYPAMANTVMAFRCMGMRDDDPRAAVAWESVKKLMIVKGEEAYCQPCVSPIWDTALTGHALFETASGIRAADREETIKRLAQATDWLKERQILDVKGDWAINCPDVAPGGWAFQYRNDYYPDVDDTAVVGMLLHRQGNPEHQESIERARQWIIGMQSSNGGWGAFDIDNNKMLLNHIPFSDHGALLDPPTVDVAARCISFLAQLGHPEDKPVIDRGIQYLRDEQEKFGAWFGRWGTNYIYGTWSALCAFNAVGISEDDPAVKKAVDWLLCVQRPDGGWGESEESYEGATPGQYHTSLPSQTAWALLGLMAAKQHHHPAVQKGIQWLMENQEVDGQWNEDPYNAVGFPRVFYLRYHGYRQFFPLFALSRYRNLQSSNTGKVEVGF